MLLQILLISAIVLQLIAAIIAIRLTKATRYNVSWILFSIALAAMAFMRFGQYHQLVGDKELSLPTDFFVWLGVISSLCFAVGMMYVSKILKDIGRREAQQRLTEKRILNTILRTEEHERSRFSKELHDGLGPLLASAKMSLSVLGNGKNDEEILRNLSYVIDESIRSLREISNNLSPHTLKDFGLERAIRNYVNKTQSITDAQLDFTSNLGERRFDNNVEIILFRVVCELMANSLKHSDATRIELSIELHGDMITLRHTDNGKGFDPGAVMEVGMGLPNIVSRIRSLKGTIDIDSEKGKGARTIIHIDLNNAVRWR